MAVAQGLLLALSEGRDEEAWEGARRLAEAVLDDRTNVLARSVLEGGPFAMRKAEALAEAVLDEIGEASEEGESSGDAASAS